MTARNQNQITHKMNNNIRNIEKYGEGYWELSTVAITSDMAESVEELEVIHYFQQGNAKVEGWMPWSAQDFVDFLKDEFLTCVDDIKRYHIYGEISDISKDVQGFRSRFDWKQYTFAELKEIRDDFQSDLEAELREEREERETKIDEAMTESPLVQNLGEMFEHVAQALI